VAAPGANAKTPDAIPGSTRIDWLAIHISHGLCLLNAGWRRPGASTEQDDECKRNDKVFHDIALYKIACSLGSRFFDEFFFRRRKKSDPHGNRAMIDYIGVSRMVPPTGIEPVSSA
jgi:hypothetical protein